MSHGPAPTKTGNAILDNPGIVAGVFTLIVLFGFVGLVVSSKGDHGGGAHGGAHGAASGAASGAHAAGSASGAASASAPAAHH